MSKPSDILNPDNPLLDSEEEDDDFEPGNLMIRSIIVIEVPITNDGLFVKTRSGKGGDGDNYSMIEDVDDSLKLKAKRMFEEMEREELNNEDGIRKKQRVDSVCLSILFHIDIQRIDDIRNR